MDREGKVLGAVGKVSDDDHSFDQMFWRNATPEERVQAIFDLRELYYEVMHPGTGSKRLDRSVGGTRFLRD